MRQEAERGDVAERDHPLRRLRIADGASQFNCRVSHRDHRHPYVPLFARMQHKSIGSAKFHSRGASCRRINRTAQHLVDPFSRDT